MAPNMSLSEKAESFAMSRWRPATCGEPRQVVCWAGRRTKTVWSAGHVGTRGSVNGTLLLAHGGVQGSTMGYCAAEEVVLRVRHYTHKTQWRS